MTTLLSPRRKQYISAAGQTIFVYPFRIYEPENIIILQTLASTGYTVTNTLVLTTDYTLTNIGVQGGGDVILTVGGALGDLITVIGNTPQERTADFNQSGDFLADDLNKEFDIFLQITQQLQTDTDRRITLKDEDPTDTLFLPTVSERASTILGFDVLGDVIPIAGVPNVPTTPFMATLLDDTTAKEGRSTLGVWDNLGPTSGIADTYDIVPTFPIVVYTKDQRYTIEININNTGASTLELNLLGANPLEKYDGAGALIALEIDDLLAGQKYDIIRNETNNKFIVLNPEKIFIDGRNITNIPHPPPTLIPTRIALSNGIDASHDIDFSNGVFQFDDATGQAIAVALTKEIDGNWVAGTNQGGLDTGSVVADTWYYCFAIYDSTNEVSDFLFSASLTTPTLPGTYDKKKRVGNILTDGGANIIGGVWKGDFFFYSSPILDFSGGVGTAASFHTLSIPLGIKTRAILNAWFVDNSSASIYISDPDTNNLAPSNTIAPLASLFGVDAGGPSNRAATQIETFSNTSSIIRVRATTAVGDFRMATLGYFDLIPN